MSGRRPGRSWRWWLLLAGCAVQAWVLAIAQSADVGTGQTSSISGIVLTDEDTPRPVRRALVMLAPSSGGSNRTTVTDDAGRFALADVPAGSYALVASRATFITSAYGAQRPARLGRPVMITSGQRLSNLVIRLWRGAVLAGTLRDERGQPVPNATVRASTSAPIGARYVSLSNNPTVTDATGAFRIFGLEPGNYFVSAQLASPVRSSTVLLDSVVEETLATLRRAGPAAPVLTRGTEPRPAQTVIYPPVWWPGTVDASRAAPIAVRAGSETTGLDLPLLQIPTAPVLGEVLLPSGQPAAGVLVRIRSEGSAADGVSLPSYSATTQADGTFALDSLPAGTYEVVATARSAGGTDMSPAPLWVVERIETSGAPQRVRLQLAPGVTIAGRVRPTAGAGPLPPGLSVALLPATVTSVSPMASLAQTAGGAAVATDGTFVIAGLRPGAPYRLFVNGIGGDRSLDSAVLGDADMAEGPLVLTQAHSSQRLEVTVSNERSRLQGTVSGEPPIDPFFVVVFPTDRSLWRSERRTRAVQPDASGRYEFDLLPPGEYWVGAVGDVDPDAWRSEVFLAQLMPHAFRITLARGERRRLDLGTR